MSKLEPLILRHQRWKRKRDGVIFWITSVYYTPGGSAADIRFTRENVPFESDVLKSGWRDDNNPAYKAANRTGRLISRKTLLKNYEVLGSQNG